MIKIRQAQHVLRRAALGSGFFGVGAVSLDRPMMIIKSMGSYREPRFTGTSSQEPGILKGNNSALCGGARMRAGDELICQPIPALS